MYPLTKAIDLTKGPIAKVLFRLAIPIMGTSFLQMAYNMTDTMWVGRLGSRAVAAVGTTGFFSWLAVAFILIPRIAAEVGVAQSVGKKDFLEVKAIIKHSLQMVMTLALAYGVVLFLFRRPLIGFFNLDASDIEANAVIYLTILSFGMIFSFLNPVFTGIYNGYGQSKTPFLINTIGLAINMILDPLLILGVGPFPRLEVEGAAIATVFAQAVVTLVFVVMTRRKTTLFHELHLLTKPSLARIKGMIQLGFPAALQSGLFTGIAMIITRMIAQWGPIPVAVQGVGYQIESLSWMTASGFQTAMSAFMGQNYGGQEWTRVKKGYLTGLTMMSLFGLSVSLLLIFGARPLFTLFIQEEETIRYGMDYLRILGFSQLFMCIEMTTAGAFNGLGRTLPPSVVGIFFNLLRIPAALFLSSSFLGLNGIWFAISGSSVLKGIVLVAWCFLALQGIHKEKDLSLAESNAA